MTDAANRLPEKVKETAERYSMLDTPSILVGFSGGVDSTVLLHILSKLCRERGTALHALHVNHMIRGEEAERDEKFCENFCKERNIPFKAVRINIPEAAAREKLGLEECARSHRYAAFDDYCSENGIKTVATAHNANDNLETILFNLTRGTSLSGICGIAPVRDNIVRPLIECSKDEITEYAKAEGLDFVFDSTNLDTDYSRNAIRLKVIPALKEINPSLVSNASRFSRSVRADSEYLTNEASRYLCEEKVKALSALEPPILSRAIALKYKSLTGKAPEAVHINAVIQLIQKGRNNSFYSLPGEITAVIRDGLFRMTREKERPAPRFEHELKIGVNRIPETGDFIFISRDISETKKYSDPLQNINKKSIISKISSDKIVGELKVRNRAEGDRYKYGGMTRSVKKLLSESELSYSEKLSLPFICDDSGIIWIPGFGVNDAYKTHDGCNTLYILYCPST